MIRVVDASAIAAVLYGEPEGATIRAHLRGDTMLAPHLIDYELANASLRRIRREPARAPAILAMLEGLNTLAIRRVATPAPDVAALAVKTGLTAYDASYLWLAMSNDAELITLDTRLARINARLRELPE